MKSSHFIFPGSLAARELICYTTVIFTRQWGLLLILSNNLFPRPSTMESCYGTRSFPQLIDLPSAWHRNQFSDESEYVYNLSSHEVEEIENALCHFKGWFSIYLAASRVWFSDSPWPRWGLDLPAELSTSDSWEKPWSYTARCPWGKGFRFGPRNKSLVLLRWGLDDDVPRCSIVHRQPSRSAGWEGKYVG